MKKNKENDMTPFPVGEKPGRPNLLFQPLIWLCSYLLTRRNRLQINKIGMHGLKPPYVVLSMHQGFMDYYITPLALFPNRASYVSDIEGFANYGKWLYSQIGCIGTRRFANNPSLVSNIRHVVNENKDIIVIFPEARHSNAGTNSVLPPSIGKLIKLLKLPVVIQKLKGSYLSQPIWDENHIRKVPIEAMLEKVLDTEEIMRMDVKMLTDFINMHFEYDEYQWQYKNRIKIEDPDRARGLHKILYLCPNCGKEGWMQSCKHALTCGFCGKIWEMDEYGRMRSDGKTEFEHIPHWYEYQREVVKNEIVRGQYQLTLGVSIDALPGQKGFVSLGTGTLTHRIEGFQLDFENGSETLYFSSKSMCSVHTEYDYREKGDCIVLSTRDCCYYLYDKNKNLNVTKIQFAAELLHDMQLKRDARIIKPVKTEVNCKFT